MKHHRLFSIVALLGLVFAAPAASASSARPERPFHASLSGQATFTFPETCPSSGCPEFTSLSDVTGVATHLGLVVMHGSHHPYDFANLLDGALTFTAANGDELYGVYDYDLCSTEPIMVTFTGGTGRFADASGTVTFTFEVVPQFQDPPCRFDFCFNPSVPWPMPWMEFVGTISY